MPQINIQIHDHDLLVEMIDNSSSKALIKRLKQSDIVLEMKEFANMEKFGVLDKNILKTMSGLRLCAGM